MIYLIFGMASSTGIFVIFRWIQHNGASTRHAILINYLVAAGVGVLVFRPGISVFNAPWFLPTAIEGVVFYLAMLVIALTTQTNGVAVASIATKMSVVVPVFTGIVILDESATLYKMLGIVTGLAAVFFTSHGGGSIKNWLWPVLAFAATGAIDASFKLFQVWSVSAPEFPAFITTIYAFAFLAAFIHLRKSGLKTINQATIMSGILMGLANFATVFCIMTVLALPGWESSVVLPVNNFGVVVLSTLVGVILFREKLAASGWIGLSLAPVAILLLYIG